MKRLDTPLIMPLYDSQKDELKKFNVSTQSTMVVFKNAKEVARSVGDTPGYHQQRPVVQNHLLEQDTGPGTNRSCELSRAIQ
jgi:hypothetical protein